jgi:hypothetical protein
MFSETPEKGDANPGWITCPGAAGKDGSSCHIILFRNRSFERAGLKMKMLNKSRRAYRNKIQCITRCPEILSLNELWD